MIIQIMYIILVKSVDLTYYKLKGVDKLWFMQQKDIHHKAASPIDWNDVVMVFLEKFFPVMWWELRLKSSSTQIRVNIHEGVLYDVYPIIQVGSRDGILAEDLDEQVYFCVSK